MSEPHPSARQRTILIAAALAVLLTGAVYFRFHSAPDPSIARQELLRFVPPDATSVIFLDLAQLRSSPFLASLRDWAPNSAEDSSYGQFVRETGFAFERDLDRAAIAVSNHGAATNLFAVADGKFDRKKIEEYAARNGTVIAQGKWKIFRVRAAGDNAGDKAGATGAGDDRAISVAFVSDKRIALTDSDDPAGFLAFLSGNSAGAEWTERFERLAGAPVFAVVRQDAAAQAAIAGFAPRGFQSPQLAALLGQLQWISLAGKPQGDLLQVVAEGECLSDTTSLQLTEMLRGVLLLAQNGLNDPKLRQQLDPAERDAYLQMVRSADIQKVNRGEWKSVRVAISITPKFLEVARTAPSHAPAPEAAESGSGKKQSPASAKRGKSK